MDNGGVVNKCFVCCKHPPTNTNNAIVVCQSADKKEGICSDCLGILSVFSILLKNSPVFHMKAHWMMLAQSKKCFVISHFKIH